MRSQPDFSQDGGRWPADWGDRLGPYTDRVDAWEVTPGQLRRRLDRDEPMVLVDVRETWEERSDTLPESLLIPLSEMRHRAFDELYPDDEIVLICPFGDRSLEAAMTLWDLGYERVRCLAGGIDRWRQEESRCLTSRRK